MNLRILALAATAALVSSPMAFAADGTITFTGNVVDTTCTISGGTAAAADFTVTLPKVSASALDVAAKTAGDTPFTITLSGCKAGTAAATGGVHTLFEAGGNVDTSTGRLKNTAASGATNVQIGILNASDRSAVKLGAPDASQNSRSATLSSGGASLNYIAQYVANGGPATAGSVTSSVTYSIVYE